ncbi:MAG: malate synthase A [Polyangiaceae bacterium]|nr:malate synthase A [Polyangiaceae bacterium]
MTECVKGRTVQPVTNLPDGVVLTSPISPQQAEILTSAALSFVAELAREFQPRIDDLLARRRERQARLDAGEERLRFLDETAHVRAGDWKIAPVPEVLLDRRVEITGPPDRKMIINALNSGASVFMADFEDSNAPTWANQLDGQINLRDAVRGTISFEGGGKAYALGERTATLFVRPRGFHLVERHMRVDGREVPGCLFDFGLFAFHNATAQLERGAGPFFYLPKMESHREAAVWDDVFCRTEARLGLPHGTIKATVLIETLPAAFEMDEILHALRDHSAGLNCGRWDYIFSFIKRRAADRAALLPDRAEVTMDKGFLRAYSLLLIKTCHRRGAHAMGGMAAQIPIKGDAAANDAALAKVRADKLREATDGHDGTWVAHPGLVPVAKAVFDERMPGKNQLGVSRDDVSVSEDDLLRVPDGRRTEAGLRHNVRVGVQYLEAWLRGSGCVPLYDLMEDAATAEISRAQAWQWLSFGVTLDGGREVTRAWFEGVVREELSKLREELGAARFDAGRFADATRLFVEMSTAARFEDFLTLPAYALLDRTLSRLVTTDHSTEPPIHDEAHHQDLRRSPGDPLRGRHPHLLAGRRRAAPRIVQGRVEPGDARRPPAVGAAAQP